MPSAVGTEPNSLPEATTSQIRNIILGFLQQCNIRYPHNITLDITYRDACYADAIRRGFDIKVMKNSLDAGIAIGDSAYRHITNYSTRIFIAIITGLAAHIDDNYKIYADGIEEFVNRLARHETQRYRVLDHFVAIMQENSQHWGTVSSNLVTTSLVDFLTSEILDRRIENMEIRPSTAPDFPRFARRISGIGQAYCFMSFPPHIDIKTWIQVVPDLIRYIGHGNDLLSFLKEELAGEKVNFITMYARTKGISKIEALQHLADETAQCYNRALKLLEPHGEAQEAFRAFCTGYVGFHALLPSRYQLYKLKL